MSILDDVDKTLKDGDNYMLNEKVDLLIDTSKATNECIAIALNDINNSLNTLINVFRNPEIKQVVIREEYDDYMFKDNHAPIMRNQYNTPKLSFMVNNEELDKVYHACQRLYDTQNRLFSIIGHLNTLK